MVRLILIKAAETRSTLIKGEERVQIQFAGEYISPHLLNTLDYWQWVSRRAAGFY